jgi:quinoprotein glucose dehydrogenase
VEQSTVPGEKTSPTQPFPTKPPAYDLQGFLPDDLINFTPQLRAEAEQIVSKYHLGPVYTPAERNRKTGRSTQGPLNCRRGAPW